MRMTNEELNDFDLVFEQQPDDESQPRPEPSAESESSTVNHNSDDGVDEEPADDTTGAMDQQDEMQDESSPDSSVDEQVDLTPLFAKIDAVRATTEDVQSELTRLAEVIDGHLIDPTTTTTLSASKLTYQCSGFLEQLTRLLFTLDSVPSHGNETLRNHRKASVKAIQAVISKGEEVLERAKQLEASARTVAPQEEQTEPADETLVDDDAETGDGAGEVDSATSDESDVSDEEEEQPPTTTQNGGMTSTAEPTEVPVNFKPVAKLVDNHSHYVALLQLPSTTLRDVNFDVDSDYYHKYLTVAGHQNPSLSRQRPKAFSTTFRLPRGVDLDSARARFDGDVLHVTIPKVVGYPMRSGNYLYRHPMASPFSHFAW